MKKKRRKRSFTAKQAERLATISIVLYGIIVVINGIVTENADILYSCRLFWIDSLVSIICTYF